MAASPRLATAHDQPDPAPAPEPLYWGDRFALRALLGGTVLMWILCLLGLVAGLWQ